MPIQLASSRGPVRTGGLGATAGATGLAWTGSGTRASVAGGLSVGVGSAVIDAGRCSCWGLVSTRTAGFGRSGGFGLATDCLIFSGAGLGCTAGEGGGWLGLGREGGGGSSAGVGAGASIGFGDWAGLGAGAAEIGSGFGASSSRTVSGRVTSGTLIGSAIISMDATTATCNSNVPHTAIQGRVSIARIIETALGRAAGTDDLDLELFE